MWISALFSMVALGMVWSAPPDYSEAFVLAVLILLALVLVSHYRFSMRIAGNNPLISLDVWYLLGLVTVSFSVPVLLVFWALPFSGIRWSPSASIHFSASVALSLLAICAFSTGFLWSWGRRERTIQSKAPRGNGALLPSLALAFLIPGTLLLSYFLVFSGATYLSGSYNDVSSVAEVYEVPFSVAQILLTLSMCCVVLRTRRLSEIIHPSNALYLAPYVITMLALTIHGDRGGVILLSSPLLYAMFRHTPKRLQTPLLLGVLLFGMLAVSILRTSRNLDDRTLGNIVDTAAEMDVSRDLKTAALNLGGSGLLLPIAMAHVEDDGVAFGRYTAISSLGLLPYSRRTLTYAGLLPQYEHYESASLLTEIVNGPNARSGVGTTTTAEFYLDLGVLGVVLGQFTIGWLAALLQFSAQRTRSDVRLAIIYVFSLGLFAVLARYSMGAFLVKILGQAFIVVRLASYFFGSRAMARTRDPRKPDNGPGTSTTGTERTVDL